MNENSGIVISLKEIYDEQKKTSQQVGEIANRIASVENRLDRQEKQQQRRDEQQEQRDQQQVQFTQKIKVTVLGALIPVALSIIYFVAKSGGL